MRNLIYKFEKLKSKLSLDKVLHALLALFILTDFETNIGQFAVIEKDWVKIGDSLCYVSCSQTSENMFESSS